jgi:putative transposase
MNIVVQLKLKPTPEQAAALLDTIRARNAAATFAAGVGFDAGEFHQFGIQPLVYYAVRERFKLSSQHACLVCSQVAGCFARDTSICPVFRPDSAVPLDSRLYRLHKGTVGITSVKGRLKGIPFDSDSRLCPTGILAKEADLIHRDDEFFLLATIEIEEAQPIDPVDWIGVDLGIVNLATDSTGEEFTGEKVQRQRRRRSTARKQFQRKGTRRAKRMLKAMSGRQARHQRHVNHAISKRLVEKAKAQSCGIKLEDLNGIRPRIEDTVSRKFRRMFGNWAFAHLRSCIEYKAKRAGVPVVLVDPRNTSRTCSRCRHCEKANRQAQAKS